MNVVGPSQSGKTFWIERLLCNLDELVVFYLYDGPFQDIFQQIKSHNDMINKNTDKKSNFY